MAFLPWCKFVCVILSLLSAVKIDLVQNLPQSNSSVEMSQRPDENLGLSYE